GTRLGRAAELLRERLEALGAAGDQDAEVAARGKQARDLHADARGGASDDRDLAHAGQAISLGSPRWPERSRGNEGSCSGSPTSGPSRGRSRASSRPAGRGWLSRTRVGESSRRGAGWPPRATRRP